MSDTYDYIYIYIYWCFTSPFFPPFRGLLTFEEKNSNSHLLFVINVLLLLGREEGKTDIISTVVIGHDPLMELFMFGSYWYLEKKKDACSLPFFFKASIGRETLLLPSLLVRIRAFTLLIRLTP